MCVYMYVYIINFVCCFICVWTLVSHIKGVGGGGGTLSVFKNKVLKKIFGPKKEELTADCRKLQNDDR